ncbi:MAG: class I SAM-dependent methyltransferase [Planctomycetota bacterium]
MTEAKSQWEPATFSFGKNWQSFLAKNYSAERAAISKACLASFLQVSDLRGKTFIDVGCGSGLSSLAAYDLGVREILSFDLDPHSVDATLSLRKLRDDPANWTVLRGSALDEAFLKSLGQWDIVYSWGVLHHTGQMWNAVRNARTLLKADGLFFIALYTTSPLSDYWIRIKKSYNRGGSLRKRLMEAHYVWRQLVAPNLAMPWRIARAVNDYKKSRGMDYMTDVRDWLGGWPYEDARIEEVWRFGVRDLGLTLVNLKTGEACTEYLFAGPEFSERSLPLSPRESIVRGSPQENADSV